MATIEQLQTALLNAHNAGDATAATTLAQEIRRMQQPPEPVQLGQAGMGDALRSVMQEASPVNRTLAGIGSAPASLYEGLKQRLGMGDDKAIHAQRIIADEAPAGALVGNVAMLAPTVAIPGANTIAGAGVVNGLAGFLQPTQGNESVAKNTTVNAVLGMAGQGAANALGKYLQGNAAKKAADMAGQQSRNAIEDATIQAAQQAGYVVPPSTVNPSWINKRLESIAGKAAVGQEAAMRNQEATNALARQTLNLPENAAISETAVKNARDAFAAPYREVAALSPDAKQALDLLKQTRVEANKQWSYFKRTGDPAVEKAARALSAEANGWENFLEQEAIKAGKPDLVASLKEARANVAKTFDVERALNTSTGNVVATDLGRAIDKGAKLSGGLETMARFADAYPQLAREASRVPTPGVSKSEAIVAALLGGGGAAFGGPAGMLAGALPLMSGPARSLVLSKPYQAAMAKHNYSQGMTGVLGKLSPESIGILARAGLLQGTAQQ